MNKIISLNNEEIECLIEAIEDSIRLADLSLKVYPSPLEEALKNRLSLLKSNPIKVDFNNGQHLYVENNEAFKEFLELNIQQKIQTAVKDLQTAYVRC